MNGSFTRESDVWDSTLVRRATTECFKLLENAPAAPTEYPALEQIKESSAFSPVSLHGCSTRCAHPHTHMQNTDRPCWIARTGRPLHLHSRRNVRDTLILSRGRQICQRGSLDAEVFRDLTAPRGLGGNWLVNETPASGACQDVDRECKQAEDDGSNVLAMSFIWVVMLGSGWVTAGVSGWWVLLNGQ